jgi:hypothetical protein
MTIPKDMPMDVIAEALAKQAIQNANVVVSAACVVLGHSLADDVINECAAMDAEFSPNDWLGELNLSRKFTLAELRNRGSDGLFEDELKRYIATFGAKSLPSRVGIFFRLVPVKHNANAPLNDPGRYRTAVLKEIDDLRHDIVHGEGMKRIDPAKTRDRVYFLTEACMTFLRSLGSKQGLDVHMPTMLAPATSQTA